ncbi:MAG: PBP1A family penicillin-binding protein [Acetobacteraceae bacterium]|nr:PBP1A family penicillin-binding protein [Acetobacteraceae bacterium]
MPRSAALQKPRAEAVTRRPSPQAREAPPARPSAPARPSLLWRLAKFALILAIWGALAAGAVLLWFVHDLPRPSIALEQTRRPSVTLQTTEGHLLATQGDLFGEVLRLRDLPPHLPAALLAIEDRRFHSHFGVDVIGLARAAYVNWQAGEVVQGGSTLTQQLAKNLFLTSERSTRRKVQEVLLALWLEQRFTKEQLLEIYLNRVYLGAGAWGMDAAARVYFGVSARRVNLWQAAMLAGLPQAPSRHNPRANPDGAMARAADVLNAMVDTGAITESQRQQAMDEMRPPPRPSRQGGWFADWVFEQVPARFPGSQDLVIRTTLDPRWQTAAEQRLAALLDSAGREARVSQGAVVVLDAGTGAIRAMVGGRDFRRSPFNRAADARRQPGSAFKPVYYLAALEQGAGPSDMVSDLPLRLGRWSPGNGQWRARGEITLEEALAHSVNTAAVRVMQQAGGARAAIEAAARLGLAGRYPRDASIALGTGEVTLLDLTASYAAFVNGGRRVEPHGMQRIESGGRTHPGDRQEPAPVIAAEVAAQMRQMLVAVVARGTGRQAAVPGVTVGGKTGTTQDYKDAWFVGFAQLASGPVLLGVWLGNDNNEGMDDVRGGTLPARLFREIVEAAR